MWAKVAQCIVWIFLAMCFTSVLTQVKHDPEPVIVSTKLGKIEGIEETTITNGKKYLSFRGIPYAMPPTKELRFKAPVSHAGWKETLECKSDGPACPQLHIATNRVIGHENCLHLNIYTPNVEDLKPVIVFIHGGGFVTGTASSQLYGPDFLMDDGTVVVVTIQYRLGLFGFLSVGQGGNWGLLDQVEALQWIQHNIASFGGDPNQVTLFGEGAGAASATLLTLSPQAQGLFRSVIAFGGTPLNSQYFQKDPLESAREIGSRIKCDYDSFDQLIACLRKADDDYLITEVNHMFSFFSFPRWFAPSVDSTSILTETPEKLLSDGKLIKVPILTGLARHEGAFYYPLTLNSFNDGKYDGNFIDQKLPRLLPVLAEFESKLFPLTRSFKKRYFTNIDYDNEDEFRPRYVEFLTDLLYSRFTSQYLNLLANQSVPAFAFILDYYGSNSIMDVIGDTDMKSIAHGDILQYVFTQVLGEGKSLPPDDLQFATKTFLPLILNFVKTGNPTPEGCDVIWPQYTSEDGTFFSVGKKLSLLPQFRRNILKFWEEIVPKVLQNRGNAEENPRDEL